jgi:two-component system response regulator AtoC
MQAYDWPGNVRELENVMRRLVILEDEQELISELTTRMGERTLERDESQVGMSLKDIAKRAALEAEYKTIRRVLDQTRWNRRKAAQLLGVSYRALQYKIKACGLEADRA